MNITMKKIVFICCVCLFTVIAMSFKSTLKVQPIAVIELFTSQGCSSCPSADRLLSQIIADARIDGRKIFALSFHVDYWNRLGWNDPFSERKYSERQYEYANVMQGSSVYTPQMVVNGSTQFVGSNADDLNNALAKSLNAKPEVTFKTLTATLQDGKKPYIQYSLEGDFTGCKINFALVSLKETTQIKRGENNGRILKNENVVRQFISEQATAMGVVWFSISPLPEKNNTAIIAYIQKNKDLKIIGAAMALIQ